MRRGKSNYYTKGVHKRIKNIQITQEIKGKIRILTPILDHLFLTIL